MRDVLAVIGVVILAVCLGVTSAYLSVDLTPPGLDLIRPPKPAVAARLRMEEHQTTIQEQASECKYCVAIAELAQTFARHAKSAREQATSLRETIALDRQGASREDELKKAERSADGAEAAAAVLTGWASRCKSEDFCRTPVRQASTACTQGASASVNAALSLAAAVRHAASGCAAAACPSIDCRASASLSSDAQYVERALALAGGRVNRQSSGAVAASLPVGASTLSAEVTRVSDEAIYVTKMLPLMLDNATTIAPNGQLPKLASDMFDERAVSAAQLASVMEHAAEINGTAGSDLRNEASWRMKSLAANLALLGQQTQSVETRNINWRLASDSLGAALVDVARLQSMMDRASDASGSASGCVATAPAAAQQLREAMAMLDLCRMRSACSNRSEGSFGASRVSPEQVAARAQTIADRLIVQELSSPDVVQASDGADANVKPIDELRGRYGVCTKAAELREATVAAPAAAQAVAESLSPAIEPVGNAVAPQDLVTGAVHSAIQVSAPAAAQEPSVVEAAAPAAQTPAQEDVIPAAAPAAAPAANSHTVATAPAEPQSAAEPAPSFTGNLLTPPSAAFVPGGDPSQPAVQPRGH
jgi:hypothetical protein